MSRIGKRPISIPKGVEVKYENREVRIKGPKGENTFMMPDLVDLEIGSEAMELKADYLNNSRARSLMGTVQATLSNIVTGVSEGFTRRLELQGVGYRAAVQGNAIDLSLGFSHPVKYELPDSVKAEMEGQTLIVLTSHDKVALGQTAANIRAIRPPEPYQGKGVKYQEETLRRKAGKTGKK